jgi:hypothetical protein
MMANADKDMEQQGLPFIAYRNAKLYNHFGRWLAVSYKTKHILIMMSSNSWYLAK